MSCSAETGSRPVCPSSRKQNKKEKSQLDDRRSVYADRLYFAENCKILEPLVCILQGILLHYIPCKV